jgi:uncharacterized protein (DUF1697 family)
MAQYLALLRGINVGGNNLIKMAELKRCFEALGFGNVATYIQSGNVLFDTGEGSPASLSATSRRAIWRQSIVSFGFRADAARGRDFASAQPLRRGGCSGGR